MSDYLRTKAVLYPITEEQADKIDKILPPYDTTPWHIEGLDDGKKINYYLSYELDSTYGEDSGDFGFSRKLTEKEVEVFNPEFMSIFFKYNIDQKDRIVYSSDLLKYVDWCYYNCCEAEDYYVNFKQDDIIAMKKKVEEKYK